MDINFFCTKWGCEEMSWKNFFSKAKKEGYDGIEFGIPRNLPYSELEEIWNLSVKNEMLIIPQHYDTYESDYSKHYDNYVSWFEKIKPFKAIKINSQTGKDFFSFEQNYSLIKEAQKFTKETGIPVYHETHRNKFSFAAHITQQYLSEIPSLQLTLDISHWVCVAESFLEDQQSSINLAIKRTEHLHARVGYTEGPQVPDPRAPEWLHALKVHLGWWDMVVARKKNEDAILTITPEFGPFPYMVLAPFTQKPMTDQWDVNVYMMKLLKDRYRVNIFQDNKNQDLEII